MCSGTIHRPLNGLVDPFSFSALNFLRNYNRLLGPTELAQCYNLTLIKESQNLPLGSLLRTAGSGNQSLNSESPISSQSVTQYRREELLERNQSPNRTTVSSSTCPVTPPRQTQYTNSSDYLQPLDTFCGNTNGGGVTTANSFDSSLSPGFIRRQRGEKRPIPDEQKDEKYYERRKRNNEAAKKSRDARKIREDRVAFRAAMLEQENSILRAQTIALREEVATLRQLMCTRANTQISLNL